MTPVATASLASAKRRLPVLLVLFVGSGAAALIYEIVWFQLLQLVVGSSAVSLGVLLGTFMGGMCAGSLLFAHVVSSRRHPLRVYAALELGIGAMGVAVPLLVSSVGSAYWAIVAPGVAGFALRGGVCALCLLPPTLLMGATLPAMARWIRTTREGVSWLGFFYGGNTMGAVIGCLAAGFYLLRVYDGVTATAVAVAANVVVAALAWSLAVREPRAEETVGEAEPGAAPTPGRRAVYVAIGLSGLTALAAEVIWTRLLSLLLGATVYTFSIILAVFLIGIGLGSSVGAFLARDVKRPRVALGLCQLALAGAMAWAAYSLGRSLPMWPVSPAIPTSPWLRFQLDVVRCLWAALPAACLWGASFPLALAAVASPGGDPGRIVGGLYAANTVGAIVGALGASLALVAWMGTAHAQQVLIACAGVAALIVLVPSAAKSTSPRSSRRLTPAIAVVFISAVTVGCVLAVPPVPWMLIAYGRSAASWAGQSTPLYVGEGLNASIAVTKRANGVRTLHVGGRAEASTDPQDMRLDRLLADLPALVQGRPASALVMGYGAGVTSGALAAFPGVRQIVICEMERLIPDAVSRYFSDPPVDLRRDPRVHVVYDDARHFVAATGEKFDLITADPMRPWVKGSAVLYTKEYFALLAAHLAPGGLVAQWVPLDESSPDAVRSEIATFFEVFPGATVWANAPDGRAPELVLLGGAAPFRIDVDAIAARFSSDAYTPVAQSLHAVGFDSAIDVLATYSGQAGDFAGWLHDAPINADRTLRLQYLAGLGVNDDRGDWIYAQMLGYRRAPADVFVGTAAALRTLWETILRPPQ